MSSVSLAVFEQPTWLAALLASLIAGLATGVGALPVAFLRGLSKRVEAALMGFSAGVMLAASFFSLLLPALQTLGAVQGSALAGALHAIGGLLIGALTLSLLNRYLPHEHFLVPPRGKRADRGSLRQMWLFVLAITLHNVPEGVAVGVGVGSGEGDIGLPVTVGISLQNMPEGLVVALSLLREGYSRGVALAVALATGLVEPLSSVFGFGALALASGVLPYALAFAAGAMIYVVSGEVIPESHRGEAAEAATWGTLLGFAVMTVLDTALG